MLMNLFLRNKIRAFVTFQIFLKWYLAIDMTLPLSRFLFFKHSRLGRPFSPVHRKSRCAPFRGCNSTLRVTRTAQLTKQLSATKMRYIGLLHIVSNKWHIYFQFHRTNFVIFLGSSRRILFNAVRRARRLQQLQPFVKFRREK